MTDILKNNKIDKDDFLDIISRPIIKYTMILMKECGKEINEDEAKSLISNIGVYFIKEKTSTEKSL